MVADILILISVSLSFGSSVQCFFASNLISFIEQKIINADKKFSAINVDLDTNKLVSIE